MTIMTWTYKDGSTKTCNERCHTATDFQRPCICNGRFTGTANNDTLQLLIINDRRKWITDAANRAQDEGADCTIHPIQFHLF